MSDAGTITAALQRRYPVPAVDPQWVQECCQALVEDGQAPTVDTVVSSIERQCTACNFVNTDAWQEEQYLFSDLSQSSIPPPPSLIPVTPHKTLLFPRPTTLQIVSITEIGSSAFQLQTVAEQRKDILSGQTLIRRMDDEVEDEDEQEANQGKLPVYPRGMLRMELSLGHGRTIKAIEYRRIGEIKLGETSLGAKMQLQNVKALRGILMLDSANACFMGGGVEHLECNQPANFLAGLVRRMGKTIPGVEQVASPTRPTRARLPSPVRNAQPIATRPQASISARPRETQTRLSFSPPKSPEKPDVEVIDMSRPTAGMSSARKAADLPMSARRTPRAASTAATARVQGLYHQTQLVNDMMHEPTPSKRPRTEPRRSLPSAARNAAVHTLQDEEEEDDFDDDFDDSFLRQVDEVAASASRPSRHVAEPDDNGTEEWGFEEDDSSFIRHVDELEARAAQPRTTSRYCNQPKQGTSDKRPVYVVDSDGDSGKENHQPGLEDVMYISD